MLSQANISELQKLAGTMPAPDHLKKKVTANDIMEAAKKLEATQQKRTSNE
ncbi:hypothetical protein J4G57_05400 [Aeromonas caviae]|uniref:hypothetical protein n=1 Tax=Aeromonas TaxID=642 RepID=UPI001BD5EF34|nr:MULTISPECIES: hypothetical protein [Aeromonas]MBS4707329.1 hypothetical protein [Aeromonas caviae]MDM5119965.1 hypothetical protein [Aeromonas hydrophila]